MGHSHMPSMVYVIIVDQLLIIQCHTANLLATQVA